MDKRSDLYLTDSQYVEALHRFRAAIVAGREFVAFDCDEPGFKDTGCTWGLCSSKPGDWPKRDFLFPDIPGRISPKYLEDRHLCPLDTRSKDAGEWALMNGCFHTCRVFQRRKYRQPMDRAQVIRFYDMRLKEWGQA